MTDPARRILALAGLLGFFGVALGAFGAHGLETVLERVEDGAQRLEWWRTAALYHLVHALAVGISAQHGRKIAPGLFTLGIVLFSGSLYAMTLGAPRGLGAITPIGGVCFLAGWAALGLSALRRGG